MSLESVTENYFIPLECNVSLVVLVLCILVLVSAHFTKQAHLLLFMAVVPNLFGTRDWFCGRQFFHRLTGSRWWGEWFGDDSSKVHIYCVLYFYYCIICTSDHQALDPGGWGPLLYGMPCEGKTFTCQPSRESKGILKIFCGCTHSTPLTYSWRGSLRILWLISSHKSVLSPESHLTSSPKGSAMKFWSTGLNLNVSPFLLQEIYWDYTFLPCPA